MPNLNQVHVQPQDLLGQDRGLHGRGPQHSSGAHRPARTEFACDFENLEDVPANVGSTRSIE